VSEELTYKKLLKKGAKEKRMEKESNEANKGRNKMKTTYKMAIRNWQTRIKKWGKKKIGF
jgi:hypothetical protein